MYQDVVILKDKTYSHQETTNSYHKIQTHMAYIRIFNIKPSTIQQIHKFMFGSGGNRLKYDSSYQLNATNAT
jgi:hypothetical protein